MNLINTGSARSARSYEPLSEEPKTREAQLEERISNNIGDFLDNHVLQLRLSETENESRNLDEEGKYYPDYDFSLRLKKKLCDNYKTVEANFSI